jgi:cell division protein FtsL
MSFVILLIILSAFIYLWQQNTSIRFAYKVSNLQVAYNKIDSENDLLRLNIDSIFAIEKIDKIAKEKNLNHSDKKSIIYID